MIGLAAPLAREILDLKAANGWAPLDLTCLPQAASLPRRK